MAVCAGLPLVDPLDLAFAEFGLERLVKVDLSAFAQFFRGLLLAGALDFLELGLDLEALLVRCRLLGVDGGVDGPSARSRARPGTAPAAALRPGGSRTRRRLSPPPWRYRDLRSASVRRPPRRLRSPSGSWLRGRRLLTSGPPERRAGFETAVSRAVAAVSAATLAASAFSMRLVEGAQHLLQTAFALFQFLACRRLRRKCGLRADDLLPPGGGFLFARSWRWRR
jgi:hypothetical protein